MMIEDGKRKKRTEELMKSPGFSRWGAASTRGGKWSKFQSTDYLLLQRKLVETVAFRGEEYRAGVVYGAWQYRARVGGAGTN